MRNSSVVGFLAFALCLFASLLSCAAAGSEPEGNEVSLLQATEAVNDAKKSIKEMSDKAQYNIGNATLLLLSVEAFKQQAEQAATQAQEAEENEKTKDIVDTIKSSFVTVNTLYQNAIIDLGSANSSMVQLLSQAKTMDDECNLITLPTTKTPENYSDEKNKATNIQSKAELLNNDITDASTKINGVHSKAQEMEKLAKKAKVANLHVSAIIAVAKIQTMMVEADNIILNAEKQKTAVSNIVKEMQNLKTTPNSASIESIKTLCEGANEALTNVTGALDNATKAREGMAQQKLNADAALKNVEKATTEKEALTAVERVQQEVNTAKGCVDNVNKLFPQLQNLIQTANTSATNAKGFKEEMEQALLDAKKKPNTEQGKETTEANPPVVDGTDSHQKDTTIQPTSKELPSQSNNNAEEIKSTLSKDAQNMPTTALTGGKAPAPGAKNDSAMTVSVPLLVALIASAVLQ